MRCAKCKAELKDSQIFCSKCGTKRKIQCPNCDASIEPGDIFCGECGTKLNRYRLKDIIYSAKRDDRQPVRLNGMVFFWNDMYLTLEDGIHIGWKYKHPPQYKEEIDYYYNLYKADSSGNIKFLNAGSRGGIETLVVTDGYAYWSYDKIFYKVALDGSGFENISEEEWQQISKD